MSLMQMSRILRSQSQTMSSEQPPETVAIAFLVESSLSVAQEWRSKLLEYSAQVLKRLGETHPGSKVCVPSCLLHTTHLTAHR